MAQMEFPDKTSRGATQAQMAQRCDYCGFSLGNHSPTCIGKPHTPAVDVEKELYKAFKQLVTELEEQGEACCETRILAVEAIKAYEAKGRL